MIYINNNSISNIYYNKHNIYAVYKGDLKVWGIIDNIIQSCFARGYWIDDKPWTDNSGWSD